MTGFLTIVAVGLRLVLGWEFWEGIAFAPTVDALPTGGDWYVARTDRGFVNHDVVYHGMDSAIDHPSKADVLLLGNSRMAAGIDHGSLIRFGGETGHLVHNLAFGDDGVSFEQQIFDKHGLRPRVVAFNYENVFFQPLLSVWAERAVSGTRLQRTKAVAAKNVVWRARWMLDAVISLPPGARLDRLREWTAFDKSIYRSAVSGAWYMVRFMVVRDSQSPKLRPTFCGEFKKHEDRAREWVKDMRSRRVEVIATAVPHNSYCPEEAAMSATALGIPFLRIGSDGLTSRDGGSHLDPPSARRFSADILGQLEAYLR